MRASSIRVAVALFAIVVSCAMAERAGASIDLVGTLSYSVSGSQVRLRADRIENNRAGGTSGTLRLELWAHTAPGPGSFYRLGYWQLGPLDAGFYYFDIDRTVPYTPPPDGVYYVSMVVTEWDGFDYNTYVDIHTFSDQLVQGGGAGIDLVGPVSYDASGGQVLLRADRVENDRNSRTGTLRLELWAHAQQTPGLFYRLGFYRLGELEASEFFFDIAATVPYTPPPRGTYFVSMVVTEWDGSDYNTYVDIRTFGQKLIQGGGGGGGGGPGPICVEDSALFGSTLLKAGRFKDAGSESITVTVCGSSFEITGIGSTSLTGSWFQRGRKAILSLDPGSRAALVDYASSRLGGAIGSGVGLRKDPKLSLKVTRSGRRIFKLITKYAGSERKATLKVKAD